MAIKAIYQHHERSTLAATVNDLQEREIGIDGATGYLVGYSATLASAVYVPSASAQLTATSVLTITAAGRLASIANFTHNGTTFAVGGSFSVTQSSGNTSVGGTLETTGLHTASSGILFAGGTIQAGAIVKSSVSGLMLRAVSGSSRDFSIQAANGTSLITVPPGAATLAIWVATAFQASAPVTMGSTLGVTGAQTNSSTLALNNLAAGQGITLTAAGDGSNMRWQYSALREFAFTLSSSSAYTTNFTNSSSGSHHLGVKGSIVVSGLSSTMGIQSNVNTSYTSLAGGNASNDGGNLLFYGSAHATLAGDIQLRDGSTNVLFYDKSAALVSISPNTSIERSASGATVSATASNTSNTANSAARNLIQVAGSSAGDAFTTWAISGGAAASLGIDNSVGGDPAIFSYSDALGTANIWRAETDVFTPLVPTYFADQAVFNHEMYVNNQVSVGAGGSVGSPTVQSVAGVSVAMVTPTADGQYYNFTNGGSNRFLLIVNTTSFYASISDGAGGFASYIAGTDGAKLTIAFIDAISGKWQSTSINPLI